MRPALLLALGLCTADADATRLIVQRVPLAGFSHHEAGSAWDALREGDPLQLEHEGVNPHDGQAVRVLWQGRMLGYLPRSANGAIARALHAGLALDARIGRLREHPDPRRRIELEIGVYRD